MLQTDTALRRKHLNKSKTTNLEEMSANRWRLVEADSVSNTDGSKISELEQLIFQRI